MFVYSIGITNAQTAPPRNCGTMEYNAALEAADPSISIKRQELEQYTQKWIDEHQDYINGEKSVISIPIVFHIVVKSTVTITDARIAEALAQLNRDYSASNTHSMGSFSSTLKANTTIQFVMAQRTPAGVATNGIERTTTTTTSFTYDDKVKSSATGGANAWDVTKYLNIWVCDLGTSLLGYAQFPYAAQGGGINTTYGLVIHYKYFGSTGAIAPYNQGGTSSHEIGHCFNLFHIWGDDQGGEDPSVCLSGTCCSETDNCADTPNQSVATFGTVTGLRTDACTTTSPGIMYMNFMDYSDDASLANFTPNQVARMLALFSSGGPLYSLTTSDGGVPVGSSAPVAQFTATPTSGVAPLVVSFTNTSTGSPTSYSWNFGDGSTSTSQNPSHTFATNGTYTVAMTATNSYGSNTVTKTNFITVSNSNNNCSGAISLTHSATCTATNGTTANATQSIAAITCAGYTGSADDDVWYKFSATASTATIKVVGATSFDAVVELRSGACNGTNINCADAAGAGGTETISATGLTVGTTYYIRVYNYDAGSSATPTFTICVSGGSSGTVVIPTVTTTAATSVTASSVATGGNVTSAGGGTVTARGVCWSTTINPVITGSKTSSGTGTGVFTSNITGLSGGTVYHIRAYATNSAGTAYGSDLTFTTLASKPTVSTTSASAIATTSATVGGNVTATGGTSVTARGVCWGTSANPTIAGSKTSNGTGTGTFSSTITGLVSGTTYNIRAYATNSAGTAYGTNKTFTTTSGSNDNCSGAITLIHRSSCITVSGTTLNATQSIAAITCGGYTGVADDDVWFKFAATGPNASIKVVGAASFDAVVELRSGACNGTNKSCADATGAGGTETISATSLTSGTTYYVRVYNYDAGSSTTPTFTICISGGTAAVAPPVVSTSEPEEITSKSSTLNGVVTDNGEEYVTERGFCWSELPNPTLVDNFVVCGSGDGIFTYRLSDLASKTLYHVRAFATNIAGTSYGDDVEFSTLVSGYSLSGNLSYISNNTLPIAESILNLIKDSTQTSVTAITDENGNFFFNNLENGSYTLECTSTQPWDGVTAIDALILKKYLNGLEYIEEPIKLIASDVNNSESITSNDILSIQRRIAGLDASFERTDWIVEKTETGGNEIIIDNGDLEQNFNVICTGDANGSFTNQSNIILNNISTINASADEIFDLPIMVSGAAQIGAFQLVINYPGDKLEIVDIIVPNQPSELIYNAVDEQLRINWSSLQTMNLAENDALVTLKVKGITNSMGYAALTLQNESELADADGNIINNINLNTSNIDLISSKTDLFGKTSIINIYPNPTKAYTIVDLGKYETKDVSVNIYNTLGEQINIFGTSSATNKIKLNFAGMSQGLYIIQINTPDGIIVKKISVNK